MARKPRFLNCKKCGNEFKSRRTTHVFCSYSCARKFFGVPKGTRNAGSFRQGAKPWNAGLKGYMLGRKASLETRRKQSEALMGENAPNWRGGISTENERFRKRRDYHHWRVAVFTRDNYTCVTCGNRSSAGNRVVLNADHIKPFSVYPELRLNVDNGRTLCVPCHKRTPTYGTSKQKFTGQKAKKINE